MTTTTATEKKYGLFDILDNIVKFKDEKLINSYPYYKEYNVFGINRALMQNPATILIAQQANTAVITDKEMHQNFLIHSVKKSNARVKWTKREDKNEYLEYVQDFYDVNEYHARQYLDILTTEQCEAIKAKFEKGGRVGKAGAKKK